MSHRVALIRNVITLWLHVPGEYSLTSHINHLNADNGYIRSKWYYCELRKRFFPLEAQEAKQRENKIKQKEKKTQEKQKQNETLP